MDPLHHSEMRLRLVTPGLCTVWVLFPCLKAILSLNIYGREKHVFLLDSLKHLAKVQGALVTWTRI